MSEPDSTSPEPRFSPGAALAAWLWPGLGHILLGERKRGLYIMGGMLGLVLAGLLIGGLDAVDRREDRLWYFAQVLAGPVVVAADVVNQTYVKSLPAEQYMRSVSLGRVNEMGTLFIALAGLMNLIVILDALYYHPHPVASPEVASPDAGEGAA